MFKFPALIPCKIFCADKVHSGFSASSENAVLWIQKKEPTFATTLFREGFRCGHRVPLYRKVREENHETPLTFER